jgi:hypothetical protein
VGSEAFGNIGAEVILGGTALGNTMVTRTTGIASQGINHSSIKRYFDITPAVNNGLNAGLILHYDVSEIEGQNESLFELYSSEDEGLTWINLGGTANPGDHTVSVSGISQLSRFTLSDTLHPLDQSGIPSAVNQPSGNRQIYLYPMPATDRIWFSETLPDAVVLNVFGQVVISRMKSVDSVSLEGLPPGTYFVRSQDRIYRFVKK